MTNDNFVFDFLVRIRPICLPVNEPVRTRAFVGYQPFVAGKNRKATVLIIRN